MTDRITSQANSHIKELVRLRKRRERDASGTFIVEGYRELLRAADAGIEVETLYVAPDLFVGGNEQALIERFRDRAVRVVETDAAPFQKASYRDRPEGLLAVAHQFPTGLETIPFEGNPLILVAEAIEKPGNLGTMLRTAEAAGLSGVIVADPTTDPFNPNVVRASLGTLFSLPLAVDETGVTIDRLRAEGVAIVATTPEGATPHHQVDFTVPTAIIVGSEQYGLTDSWLSAADVTTVIPMPGSVDSLNAAMAAGIVVFEALRQRS